MRGTTFDRRDECRSHDACCRKDLPKMRCRATANRPARVNETAVGIPVVVVVVASELADLADSFGFRDE